MFDEMNTSQENEAQQAQWRGWTPPWMSGEEQGPRGPFGPGRGFGPRGWQGPRGPFGRGFGGPRGWQGPFGSGHEHGHGHGHHGPGRWQGIPEELLALRVEAAEVARLFAIASRGAFENKERVAELRAFLDRSHKELADMIFGTAQKQPTGEGQSESGSSNVEQA